MEKAKTPQFFMRRIFAFFLSFAFAFSHASPAFSLRPPIQGNVESGLEEALRGDSFRPQKASRAAGTLPVLVSPDRFQAKAVISAGDVGEDWEIGRVQRLKDQYGWKHSRPLIGVRRLFSGIFDEGQWRGIIQRMLQEYDQASRRNPDLFLPLRGHDLLIYDGAYLAQTYRPSDEEAKFGRMYTLVGLNSRLLRRSISMETKFLALRHEAQEAAEASHDFILQQDIRYIQTLDRKVRDRVFGELKSLGFAYRYIELLREGSRQDLEDPVQLKVVEDRIARFIARSIREGDDESAKPIHFYPALCRQIVEANKEHDLTDVDGLRFLTEQVRQQPRIRLELTTLAIFTNREVVSVIARFFGTGDLKNNGLADFDRTELQEQLERVLSPWNAMEGVPEVHVDYESLALIGNVLYVPVFANGVRAYIRYFSPRSPPFDQASFKWSVELGENLSAEFLLHSEFIRATISRSRYKAEFLRKTLQSFSRIGPGERLYVARGDIDFLKKLNNLYGDGVMNAVLALLQPVMSNHLEDLNRTHGLSERFNMVLGGDESSVASPPCRMTPEQITQAMSGLHAAIQERLKGYGVLALKDFGKRFRQLYPVQQQGLLEEISKLGAVLELDERRAGNLILFKLEDPDNLEYSRGVFTQKVNKLLADLKQSPVASTYQWLKDGSAFLDGRLWIPTLSMGIVELEDVLEEAFPGRKLSELTDSQREQLLQQALFRAEDGLEVAKKTRGRVVYGLQPKRIHTAAKDHLNALTDRDFSKIEAAPSIPADERDNHDPRIKSEGAFRRDVYQAILDKEPAKLIEIKAVYRGPKVEAFLASLTGEEIRDLRGNDKGVGLKAINDNLGHEAGDVIIKALMDSIIEHVPRGWYLKVTPPTGPPEQQLPWMMRFVDNMRIFVAKPEGVPPTDGEIGRLVDSARATFNERIKGITVAQLTANVVDTRDFPTPGVVFEKLQALGSLHDLSGRFLTRTPAGNLVKNYSPLLEDRILDFYEDFSFESAQQLLAYAQTADQNRMRTLAIEESVAQHLSVNFNSPEFAAAWDEIAVGSSNREFWGRIQDVVPVNGARVMDLATGTGKGLEPIAEKLQGGLLVGVDTSAAMLDYAKKKFSSRYPHGNHLFVEGDARVLVEVIPDEWMADFDAVISRFWFNFAPLDQILPQVHQKLRPGGKLVFNVFGGFFWGNSPLFWSSNPFEAARAKAAKEVLEEELLPTFSRGQREKLIQEKQIAPRPTGGWEIIAEPVTQDKGLDAASLEKVLRHSKFEEVVMEPVGEMYPVQERQKSALLTASIPYYWTIWNMVGGDANRGLRLRLIEKIWDRMPDEMKTGERLFTDIFVSARKPGAGLEEGKAAFAGVLLDVEQKAKDLASLARNL